MPRGDRTGPMGLGPMTGRAAGYCAGSNMPGYMNPGPGRGSWGRGAWGGGGRGWRHWYYATGLPGWARAGWGLPAWGAAPYPYAPPIPPDAIEETELETLKAQAGSLERTLQALRRRIEKLEGEGKAE
jgi:hypothetical protein